MARDVLGTNFSVATDIHPVVEGVQLRYSAIRDAWEQIQVMDVYADLEGMSAGGSAASNSAALLNAVARVPANVTGRVIMPAGTLLLDTGQINFNRSNLWLAGRGMEDTVLSCSRSLSSQIISAAESFTPTVGLGVNITPGTQVVTPPGGNSAITVGMWMKLWSNESFDPTDDPGIGRSEWVQVLAKDVLADLTTPSVGSVVFQGKVRDKYSAGTATATFASGNATITLVSPTTGFLNGMPIYGANIPSNTTILSGAGTATIVMSNPASGSGVGATFWAGATLSGQVMKAGLRFSDFSMTATNPLAQGDLLRVACAIRPLVEHCRFFNNFGNGLVFQHTVDAIAQDVWCEDIADTGLTGGTGYALLAAKLNEGLQVSNYHARRCQHGFTTGANEVAGVLNVGTTWGPVVINSYGEQHHATPFDTHSNCYNAIFANCHATRNATAGFNARGKGSKMIGCTSVQDPVGIATNNGAHDLQLIGCQIFNAGSRGIVVRGSDGVTIQGCLIDGVGGSAILIDNGSNGLTRKSDRLTITDNVIRNPGQDVAQKASWGASGIFVNSSLFASQRWSIRRNLFDYRVPDTDFIRYIPSGTVPDFAIENQATLLTNSIIEDNRITGMPSIKDAGSGNIKRNNVRIDGPWILGSRRSGVIAQTVERAGSGILGSIAASLSAGRFQVAGCKVEAGSHITAIRIPSGTGTPANITLIQFALIDMTTKNVLAISADGSAANDDNGLAGWGTGAYKTLNLQVAYDVPDDTFLGVGVLEYGAAAPTTNLLLGTTIHAVTATPIASPTAPYTCYTGNVNTFTTAVTVGTTIAASTNQALSVPFFLAELLGT